MYILEHREQYRYHKQILFHLMKYRSVLNIFLFFKGLRISYILFKKSKTALNAGLDAVIVM